MAQRRMALALAALLTIAALGFVATAIDDGNVGSAGTGSGGATGTGSGSTQASGSQTVAAIVVIAILVLAVGGIAATAYRDSLPQWLVVVLLVSVAVLILLVAVGHLLEPPQKEESDMTQTPGPDPTTPGPPTSGSNTGPLSTTSILVVLGVLLAGGALVVTRFSRGVPEETPAEGRADDDSAAVAEAAGRAADELDETTLSNAVFRAWQEMTDTLDVENPETTTPAEFEDIAVEAGLDREDVATLTDLFREVRYGDAPATTEREERARTVLRHIEDSYAESDATADGRDATADGRDATADGRDADSGGDRQ